MTQSPGICGGIGLAAALAGSVAAAGQLNMELNKLEDGDGACRAYVVFDNATGGAFEALRLDLVVFDKNGVIVRRLAVDTAPLRAAKTTVKMFDLAGLACAGIARILVNDVLDCRAGGGAQTDCVDRLTLTSRAGVELVK